MQAARPKERFVEPGDNLGDIDHPAVSEDDTRLLRAKVSVLQEFHMIKIA
jgi:hypothetical protein